MKQVAINQTQASVVISAPTNAAGIKVSAVGPITVAVQTSVTAVSSPVGTAIQLQGSLDGVNYFNVGSSQAVSIVAEYCLVDTAPAYAFYRLQYARTTGTFTVSARFFVYGQAV